MAFLDDVLTGLGESTAAIEDEALREQITGLINWTKNYNKNRPGFFTPFRSTCDVVTTAVSPISTPLIIGAFSLLGGVVALASAALSAACVIFSVPAFLFDVDSGKLALIGALVGAGVSIVAAGVSLLLAVAAIVSIPLNALNVLTRTVSTLGSLAGCCVSEQPEEEAEAVCCF